MADPRFFGAPHRQMLGDLALACGAACPPEAVGVEIADVAPLDRAGPGALSFAEDRASLAGLAESTAQAVFVPKSAPATGPGPVRLSCAVPRLAFARACALIYPEPGLVPGIHPTAVIAADAEISPGVRIDAYAVIDAGARIEAGAWIGPQVSVGPAVVVGADTRIGAGASLSHCLIGVQCLIHPGVRIGQRGFGFVPGAEGLVKVPQLGRVIIEDYVEIGANSTIDRGGQRDTVIGRGTVIDNLVQIGHNVRVGQGCVIVAQTGISGSCVLGDRVMVGGQAGIADHLTIGTGAQIAAQSGVMRNVAPGAVVMGSPALPNKEFLRGVAWLSRQAQRKDG